VTLRGRGQVFDVAGVIGANQDARGARKPRQAIDFNGIGHLVRNHYVVDAAGNHDLGLGNLLTANAAGAAVLHLVARDIYRLVRFRVRAMAHAGSLQAVAQGFDIGLESVEIDDQRRRADLRQPHANLGGQVEADGELFIDVIHGDL
jgi:hypothetical protein